MKNGIKIPKTIVNAAKNSIRLNAVTMLSELVVPVAEHGEHEQRAQLQFVG